ncbi:MAG TPA: histidine phosphatase family protein [Cyclobacteriaceae bacterium]|nr:histidine phosphatase family protein [Cyclobacteriaceae bacterium]
MKTLYLVRHAKSSWEDQGLADFDRPLSDRGVSDAPRMGRRITEYKQHPQLIYSSPAVRALNTAKIIASAIDYPEQSIVTDRRVYHSDADALLDIVRKFADDTECVMLVGHNPGLTQFANALLGETIDNISTCGVVRAELKITSWRAAKWGCGKLISFDTPKSITT